MRALVNGDFDLDGYVIGDNEPIFMTQFNPGAPWWRTQDNVNSAGPERFFGRDHMTGPTWSFQMTVNTTSTDAAFTALQEAASVWRQTGRDPSEESVLRYCINGRTRRVYGRPRQFSYTLDSKMHGGVVPAEATFITSDPWYYDDTLRGLTIGLRPGAAAGLVGPLKGSLSTVVGGSHSGIINDVGGTRPAPFELAITGPVVDPVVEGDGWTLALNMTLLRGQSVVIDTRRNTVLRDDGASVSGALSRRSRLAKARLAPGSTRIYLRGKDSTGTASCALSWRPTFDAL